MNFGASTHCHDAQQVVHQLHYLQSCNGYLQIIIQCMRALGYTYKLQLQFQLRHACCTLFCMVACLAAKLPQPAADLCGIQTVVPATTWGMQIMMLHAFSHYGQPQQNVFVLFLQAHILLKSLITMASTGTEPHLMKAVVIRSQRC